MMKKNLDMFCISLNPEHLNFIKELNYIPVGLGKKKFNSSWITDKAHREISEKNDFYGEYTFHYKLWKNNEIKLNNWVGFCQYRKFWVNKEIFNKDISFDELKSVTITEIPEHISTYDSIIGQNLFINQFRISKFIKKRLKKLIFEPKLLFSKNRTIKFHFDMMHGEGNLEKAISVLDISEKNDFNDFVNREVSFNPHNMFICKDKNILFSYYDSLFPWLERCERIFGFENLEGYGLKRIYGFLAERYMSYWFKKYTKYYLMNICFKDLNDFIYRH
jgi:hypothetical protein